jgi:hypothetical protein
MQITGIIEHIGEVQQVSDNFKKREVWITIDHDTEYPQTINMELQQDKVDIIDAYQLNQEVEVSINLRGRKWDKGDGSPTRCFNTIQIWRISPADGAAAPQHTTAPQQDTSHVPEEDN